MTMPRLWAAPGLLAAALAVAAPVRSAPPPADARTAIGAVYDQINADFERRDVTGLMTFIAPDYTAVDPKGATSSRDQARRQYESQRDQIKTLHSRWVLESLTPLVDGALVEMRMHTDGTGTKKILFARLTGTFTNDLWVRDLWVDTPQGWRLKHRQTLLDQTHTHPG